MFVSHWGTILTYNISIFLKNVDKEDTYSNPVLGMYADVFSQMVGSHEPLATLGTLEPLLSCMRTPVPLELIRTRKPGMEIK